MRGLGILTMLEIGAGLSMAGPLFIVGVDFLGRGRFVVGAGFLFLGAFAMFFPRFLLRRFLGGGSVLPWRGGDERSDEGGGIVDRLRGR